MNWIDEQASPVILEPDWNVQCLKLFPKTLFVDLKTNSALIYNKSDNLLKSVFPSNNVKLFMFPYKKKNINFEQDL